MKRFKHSSGTEFVFGANMEAGDPQEIPNCISWNDPKLDEWETKKSNEAGHVLLNIKFYPQIIFEHENRVVAYQPGLCIEFEYVGGDFIWAVKMLVPAWSATNIRAA